MDELDAVNMLLRLIGSSPVNDLETPHPDVANARTTLDRMRKQLQRKSWWFNTDYGVELQPNTQGYIEIPKTYNTIVFECGEYVVRSGKVYDKTIQSAKINKVVKVHLIVHILDWDDLPKTAQDYCAYQAGSQFIRDELEDPSKSQQLDTDAVKSYVQLKNEDLVSNNYNMFSKARVVKARAGVRPYGMHNHFLRQR